MSSVGQSRKSRRFRFETVDFKMGLWECNFGKVGESRIRALGGLDADALAFSKLSPYEEAWAINDLLLAWSVHFDRAKMQRSFRRCVAFR